MPQIEPEIVHLTSSAQDGADGGAAQP
jgi:hypothetical protein